MAAINLPRIIRVGGGALAQLPEALAQCGVSRPFIVTDAFLVSSGMVATLLAVLDDAGIDAVVFAETVPDPTVAVVETALEPLLFVTMLFLGRSIVGGSGRLSRPSASAASISSRGIERLAVVMEGLGRSAARPHWLCRGGPEGGGDDPEQGGVGTRGSEGDPDAGGGLDDACGDFEEPQA